MRSDIAVHLYGDNLELLADKAGEIAAVLQRIPGAADVNAEQTQGLPMLRIIIDRTAIARYGINAADVLDVVETVGGRSLGTVQEGEKRFVLQARFSGELLNDLDRIRDLRVAAPAAGGGLPPLIPLSQLADIRIEGGPAQISRDKISRRINVEANVRGRG